MKNKLLFKIIVLLLLFFPKIHFGQAPNLGSAADYTLFSTIGAVTNVGSPFLTRITGNVGTASDPTLPNFGNVDGVMTVVSDPRSTACAADLLLAFNDIDTRGADFFPSALMGNGLTFLPGVYSIPTVASLNLDLTFDAQNDPNALFIVQIGGAFSTSANAKIKLVNGALACNIFWTVEGKVDMGTGTSFKGTIIANNDEIVMTTGDTLEGRAFSTNGAITVTGIFAFKPIGCGSLLLTGPIAPNLGTAACFALLNEDGAHINNGISNIVGDVGTNGAGKTTDGYDPLLVVGDIHPIPDGVTLQASTDLAVAYAYLNGLNPGDIELMRPDLFGHNLILTPHTYLMLGAVTFTDTVFLDAQGNADAVFVINVNGAFTSTVNSRVVLINGTQAKNVYWKVDGALIINDNSIFNGTLVVAGGSITLATGVTLNGRALLSGAGAINASAVNVSIPSSCSPEITVQASDVTVCEGLPAVFTVVATGVNLTFQWRKGLVNIPEGAPFTGTQSDELTIDPTVLLDAGNDYNVVVTGDFTPSVTSDDVTLTILTAPSITTQATDVTVCEGNLASFEVVAEGTNITYQWRKGLVNLIEGAPITGTDGPILTIDPTVLSDAGNNYNVVVSGTCPSPVTSNNYTLIIETSPSITTQASDITVCEGDLASFTVAASGTNLTFQWRKGLVNLIEGGRFTGTDGPILTIDPTVLLDAGNDYNVVISGDCPTSVTSNNYTLTIDSAPSITTQATDVTVCEGNPASFTVAATGTNLTFQWRKGLVNLIEGGRFTGTDGPTLTIDPTTALDAGIDYNVVVSGDCPTAVISNDYALIIEIAPIITTQATNVTVCEGNPAIFTVTATGTNLTFQWRKGLVNLVDGGNISGATSSILTIDPTTVLDAGNDYNLVITGDCPTPVTSNNYSLTIQTSPVITTQASNSSVCEGSLASFNVIATGTNLTFQWRKGLVNLVDGPSISGATSSTLTIDPTTLSDSGIDYNLVVSGTCPSSVTSINYILTVNEIPVAIASVVSPACLGESISLSAETVAGATYQWSHANGYSSSNQNETITTVSLADSGVYTLVVTNNGCISTPSSVSVSVIDCDTLEFNIPEGFSPNGDGTNDLFVIRGIDRFPENNFTIYNRWGDKIYEKSSYLNTWDGTNTFGVTVGTDELPVGTYFYVLFLDNNSDAIKGTIYLNR